MVGVTLHLDGQSIQRLPMKNHVTMKKIPLILTMAAILAACQQEELVPEMSQTSSADYTAILEDFAPVAKTSLTETNRVVWNKGDELMIFQGYTLGDRYKVSDESAGTSNGVFSIVRGEGGVTDVDFVSGTELSRNVAVYPYGEDVTIDNAANPDTEETIGYVLSGIEIPAVQTYSENSFANGAFPMVAVTVDKPDHRLKFNNAAGALKLKLKGSGKVKSIKVEGNNGEKLSGAAIVTAWFEDGKKPTLVMSEDAGTSVLLDCGEGVQLSASEATVFIIALPPVEFAEGFTVTITNTDDVEKEIRTNAENVVMRSSLLAMPALTLGINFNGTLKDYVDEYNVNHGPGVEIDGVVWAPVNCGYHETDYPYGKLYQWGRKYGQGYSGNLYDSDGNLVGQISDATYPSGENLVEGPVEASWGSSSGRSEDFFYGSPDWRINQDDNLWGYISDRKTANDPCPTGWRMPSYDELDKLIVNHSSWTTNSKGQNGFYFVGEHTYEDDIPKIFFPAAGLRSDNGVIFPRDTWGGYWSSTPDANTSIHLIFIGSDSGGSANMSCWPRATGSSVRCVQDLSEFANFTPIEDVSIVEESLIMYPETEYQLNYELLSNMYDDIDITWSSDNLSVAMVDSNGKVTTLSDGTAEIKVSIGTMTDFCTVIVRSAPYVTIKNYVVDGVDYGPGINIGGIVWAPVNCGYEPATADYKGYPYGKLYQWGRRHGQGYNGELWDVNYYVEEVTDAMYPSGENLVEGTVSPSVGNSEENKDVFYYANISPFDWCRVQLDDLWGYGIDEKSAMDPCPAGWRVPTVDELDKLIVNHSSWTTNSEGQNGFYFVGEYTYMEDISRVFLPAAGYRYYYDGDAFDRGGIGRYWSSEPYIYDMGSATGIAFHNDNYHGIFSICGGRAHGYSVRCVQE